MFTKKKLVFVFFFFILFLCFLLLLFIKTDNVKYKHQTIVNCNEKIIFEEPFINVFTDVFSIRITRNGGDIVSVKLLKYPCSLSNLTNVFSLLDSSENRFSIFQSGLINDVVGPDSLYKGRINYTIEKDIFILGENDYSISVNLFYEAENLKLCKQFSFFRNSYLIFIKYLLENKSKESQQWYFYGKLKTYDLINSQKFWYDYIFSPNLNNKNFVYSTNTEKFSKLSFSDIKKKDFSTESIGGWLSLVDRYFLCAVVLNDFDSFTFYTEKINSKIYCFCFVQTNPFILSPNEIGEIGFSFYTGPIIGKVLKNVSRNLRLVVDYGFFWFISQPLFFLLCFINDFINNWGYSIIALTIIIRLIFFPFSAISYRAMARLRMLQPKIENLKSFYRDDKKQLGSALINLYKKENVNPLSGCLPILIQIPFFIAFYYVLLQSVELRMAPFIFWIEDLSVKDPYFFLPILMGFSMVIQQKLNPKPADKFQEYFMSVLPFFFIFLFLQFPSGLVLYWVVNNFFSIFQQWYVLKKYK